MNFLPAAVVTERIREAHQNKSAPLMMLFPGYHPSMFFFGGGGLGVGGGVYGSNSSFWFSTKLGLSSQIGAGYPHTNVYALD